MLTRDEILARTKLKTEIVTVDEWGGDVVVSEMTGTDRDAWEQSLKKDDAGRIVSPRAKLIVFSLVDESGARLFNDNDTDAVGKLSAASLEKVCSVAMKLNGLLSGDVEEARKN